MILKHCLDCKYHKIKLEGNEETSHCQRENCYSRFTKCVLYKALEKFLKEESFRSTHRFQSP